MGYKMGLKEFDKIFEILSQDYEIYGPKTIEKAGRFSDTNNIRYEKISSIEELEYKEKSLFSPKDVLFPVNETMFNIEGEKLKEIEEEDKKYLIFLRSCDLNAIDRLDNMFLKNGNIEDNYYKKKRQNTKFILMECIESYLNCFCVSMNTNKADNYSMGIKLANDEIYLEIKDKEFDDLFKGCEKENYTVKFIEENQHKVEVPNIEDIKLELFNDEMWEAYDRCIGCGRCNFSCPTCTCFTTTDIYYDENKTKGERRRTWASCHVDGFSDMAGGHSFRQNTGSRMRYKVMHKIYNYKKRFGENMCVGCGRCDDRCPEYISYAKCINLVTEKTREEA